jgi:hypothetical protein
MVVREAKKENKYYNFHYTKKVQYLLRQTLLPKVIRGACLYVSTGLVHNYSGYGAHDNVSKCDLSEKATRH